MVPTTYFYDQIIHRKVTMLLLQFGLKNKQKNEITKKIGAPLWVFEIKSDSQNIYCAHECKIVSKSFTVFLLFSEKKYLYQEVP